MWTCKIDSDGNVLWSYLCGSLGKDRAYNVTRDWDGHVLVTGKDSLNSGCVDDNHGSSDVWLMKLDFNTGQLIWEKSFGGTMDDEGFRTIPTPDHGYLVGATSQSDDFDVPGNRGLSDYWVFKTDSLLNIEWSVNWGGGSWDHLNDLVELTDGSYAAVGFSSSDKGPKSMTDTNFGSFDSWMVRFINCDTVPDIAISGATSFCDGGQVTLTAPVSQSYLWSNGATTPSIVVDTTSSYTVIVTSFDSACVGYSNAVQVTEFSLPPIPLINGSNGTFTSSIANHYQWYLNGNVMVGDTNQTFIPIAFGAYNVVITDSNGCTASSATFTYAAINELNTSKDFTIYPNPTSSKIVWIENKGVDLKNAEIRILNSAGAVVKSYNATALKSGNKLYFDLSKYSSGYYRILIDTTEKRYAYPLIVK
ncbi:MAG: T9SS type A sorting domain-containing protein [Bacteroidetes bacterium]|nr:T9SS type A sorting domain-containing protein [Bacteroidota bacterium]